jgi:hypothetical protein
MEEVNYVDKGNKINIIIIVVCLAIVLSSCIFLVATRKPKTTSDAEKFKATYEAYNNLEVDENTTLFEIEIPEDNPIVIKSAGEIAKIIEEETAIIYFGYPSNQSSRNMINILFDVLKQKGVDSIYYLDISDIRDEYKNNNTLDPELVKKGTDAYYKIVDLLSDSLQEYYVSDGGMFYYDTGVKRINAPSIAVVSKGEVVEFYEGLVESHTDENELLTDDEKQELTEIYSNIVDEYVNIPQACSTLETGC